MIRLISEQVTFICAFCVFCCTLWIRAYLKTFAEISFFRAATATPHFA